jgi:hypothetical protein
MKVTIEFDSVSDRDVLEAVLSSLPTRPYSPPEYIHVVAPPPAEPFGAHGFGDHGKPPAPPVEPMAVPVEEKYIPVAADTVSPAPAGFTPPVMAVGGPLYDAPPPVEDEYVPPEVSEYAPAKAFVQPPGGVALIPLAALGPDRDADGLPWDGRIHSSSKALLVDGKWRQRRNTDPAVVAAVTAELRAALGAPAAPVEFVRRDIPVPPVEFVRRDIPVPPVELPPPALAVVPPPPPPVDTAMTFPEFMKAITAARIPPGTVLDACKAVGMPSIPALNQRPDLIPTVAAALGVA